MAASLSGHLRAGRLAAGEGHGPHARVVNQAGHLRGADRQALKYAGGESGAADHVLDFQCALGYVGGMFQDPHVAGHQRRRGEAEDLPEGKIPRHHGQHRSDGLKLQVACAGAGVQWFVRQQSLAVFGVVAAGQRALGGFGSGCADRLAHFEGHDAPQAVFFLFQDAGRGREPAGAGSERRVPVRAISGIGARQRGVHLGVGEGVEGAQGLAGGGVDRGNHQPLL